jgi:hypothetical protein
MANFNVVCIIKDVSVGSIDPTNLTLVASIEFWRPDNGAKVYADGVQVTRAFATSTAAQWKTSTIAAVKAVAAAPPGSADTYTIVTVIGFTDIGVAQNP